MKQDVDLIIIPSYWKLDEPGSTMVRHDPRGENESKLIDGLVTSRALESEACVVFVNCGGKKEEGFLGRSCVSLPLKGLLINCLEPHEQLQIIDLDLSVLKVFIVSPLSFVCLHKSFPFTETNCPFCLKDASEVYKIRHEYHSKPF